MESRAHPAQVFCALVLSNKGKPAPSSSATTYIKTQRCWQIFLVAHHFRVALWTHEYLRCPVCKGHIGCARCALAEPCGLAVQQIASVPCTGSAGFVHNQSNETGLYLQADDRAYQRCNLCWGTVSPNPLSTYSHIKNARWCTTWHHE